MPHLGGSTLEPTLRLGPNRDIVAGFIGMPQRVGLPRPISRSSVIMDIGGLDFALCAQF